jgi:hypothetical protein
VPHTDYRTRLRHVGIPPPIHGTGGVRKVAGSAAALLNGLQCPKRSLGLSNVSHELGQGTQR